MTASTKSSFWGPVRFRPGRRSVYLGVHPARFVQLLPSAVGITLFAAVNEDFVNTLECAFFGKWRWSWSFAMVLVNPRDFDKINRRNLREVHDLALCYVLGFESISPTRYLVSFFPISQYRTHPTNSLSPPGMVPLHKSLSTIPQ